MIETLLSTLRRTLGDELVSVKRIDREDGSADASDMRATLPDVVVWPEATEDVLFVMEQCRRHRVPLTPRGGGVGHSGGAIPIRGGLVLDCSRMTETLDIDRIGGRVRVSAGVSVDALATACKQAGLMLPIMAGEAPEGATVGGMIATDACGSRALGYGSSRHFVRGLTAVTGEAEVIRTGYECAKGSSAYDLTQTLIGSEGTLAVICEATLSLTPTPAFVRSQGWRFQDAEVAVAVVGPLINSNVALSACELVDCRTAELLGLGSEALLLIEVCGDTQGMVEERGKRLGSVLRQGSGRPLNVGREGFFRRAIIEAIRAKHPGKLTIRADLGCPYPDLPGLLALARNLARREKLALYCFGPVGLGVVDIVIEEDPTDLQRWEEASEVKGHLVDFVVDRGGACSAGGGVGLAHRRHLKREHGLAVELMRRLATAFDPHGLLNPGKMLP